MNPRSLQSFDSLTDRVRMHRTADKRPVVIVEGVSDHRLVDRISANSWSVFVAGTRSSVILAVEDLCNSKERKVAGIIDRDFDDVFQDVQSRIPVFAWNGADLEAHLLDTRAFSDLVNEYASPVKLEREGGIEKARDAVVKIAVEVGFLRRLNHEMGWGLAFDNVDLAKKLTKEEWGLRLDSFCDALASVSPSSPPSKDIVTRYKSLGIREGRQPLYRGKDALSVLGFALKKKIGSCPQAVCDVDNLSRALRLAVPSEAWD